MLRNMPELKNALKHNCSWWFSLDTVENITSELIFLINPAELDLVLLTALPTFPFHFMHSLSH